MQTYDFKVVYKPGRSNIADVLSKLNSVTPILGPNSEFQMIALHSTAHCFRQEIEEDSKTDPEPEVVHKCLDQGCGSGYFSTASTNKKREATLDNFFYFCGSVVCLLLHFIILRIKNFFFIAIT